MYGPRGITAVPHRRAGLPLVAGVLAAIAIANPSSAFADGSYPFGDRTALSFAPSALGDFDGDGHLDLLGTDGDPRQTVLALGRGDGTFAAPAPVAGPGEHATGYFNADDRLDFVVATSASTQIMLNDGQGSFAAAGESGGLTRCSAPAVGDFNSDGTDDIAVCRDDAVDITLTEPDGQTESPVATPVPVEPGDPDGAASPATRVTALAAGDFDSAPGADLIVATGEGMYGRGEARVLSSEADGTFSVGPSQGGGFQTSVDVADLNDDGLDDAVFGADGVQSAANLSVRMNEGGSMGPPTPLDSLGTYGRGAAFGDFDGDGATDIVGAYGQYGGSFAGPEVFFSQPGGGSFGPGVTRDRGGYDVNASDVFVGDLNSDGQDDLVVDDSGYDAGDLVPHGSVLLGGASEQTLAVLQFRPPTLSGSKARPGSLRLSSNSWNTARVELRVPRRAAKRAGLPSARIANLRFSESGRKALPLRVKQRVARRLSKAGVRSANVSGIAHVRSPQGARAFRLR